MRRELGRLCGVVGDLTLPLFPREADLLDAAGGVVAGLVAAAAADHRDFFFEGGQPVGQVEAGAGRFAGQAGDFLLERGERVAVARAGGGDGGADRVRGRGRSRAGG